MENIKTFVRRAAIHLNNQAAADQIGTLLAGKYLLHDTGLITDEAASEFLIRHTFEDHTQLGKPVDTEQLLARILTHVLRLQLGVGARDASLGELIQCAAEGREFQGINSDNAILALARAGIRVDADAGVFMIANAAPEITKLLRETQWRAGWAMALKQVEGAETIAKTYFAPGLASRGVSLPLALVGGGAETGGRQGDTDTLL